MLTWITFRSIGPQYYHRKLENVSLQIRVCAKTNCKKEWKRDTLTASVIETRLGREHVLRVVVVQNDLPETNV